MLWKCRCWFRRSGWARGSTSLAKYQVRSMNADERTTVWVAGPRHLHSLILSIYQLLNPIISIYIIPLKETFSLPLMGARLESLLSWIKTMSIKPISLLFVWLFQMEAKFLPERDWFFSFPFLPSSPSFFLLFFLLSSHLSITFLLQSITHALQKKKITSFLHIKSPVTLLSIGNHC